MTEAPKECDIAVVISKQKLAFGVVGPNGERGEGDRRVKKI